MLRRGNVRGERQEIKRDRAKQNKNKKAAGNLEEAAAGQAIHKSSDTGRKCGSEESVRATGKVQEAPKKSQSYRNI